MCGGLLEKVPFGVTSRLGLVHLACLKLLHTVGHLSRTDQEAADVRRVLLLQDALGFPRTVGLDLTADRIDMEQPLPALLVAEVDSLAVPELALEDDQSRYLCLSSDNRYALLTPTLVTDGLCLKPDHAVCSVYGFVRLQSSTMRLESRIPAFACQPTDLVLAQLELCKCCCGHAGCYRSRPSR